MRLLSSTVAVFALFLSLVYSADSPFAGEWETNWGDLVIESSEEKLTGSYSGKFTGTIEGSVKDDGTFHFVWKQKNAEWGSGVFTLSEDGKKLDGTWGGAESETNGGAWTGTRK